MKRLHFLGLICVCLGIAAVMLFRANTHAIAATPSSCGSWNVVASPNNGNSSLSGIATIAANDIWAVGSSQPDNKIYSKTLIEHWDGTSWSIVPSPNVPSVNNYLSGVSAASATNIWAVGDSRYGALFEHWDGTAWSIVPGPNSTLSRNSVLTGVAAVSATDIWAVGYAYPGAFTQTVTEHWNGTKWSVVPNQVSSQANYLSGVTAVSTNNVWAVGQDAFDEKTLIEHWDGTAWKVVHSPNPAYYSFLYGVTAISATSIWAVGSSNTTTLIEHWDGTKWSVVPSAPANGATLQAIGVVSATDIWAVGNTYSNGVTSILTEHWDGTTWSVVTSPDPGDHGNNFNAVASIPGSNYVWAVGQARSVTTNDQFLSNTLTAYYC